MIKDYTLRTEIECSAEREARLQKEWEKTLPCFGCEFSQLCKFKGMLNAQIMTRLCLISPLNVMLWANFVKRL